MNEPLIYRLAIALGIGLIVGLERGWKTRDQHAGQRLAGVRTFSLAALLGGALAAIATPDRYVVLAAGALAVGALVIAVHSMEEPEELPGDIDLEFFLPEVSEDHSVTVLLSAFLHVWLPLIRGDERAIVLVVCNPNETLLPAPPAAGQTPFYYPLGDVESWLHGGDDHKGVRLVARSWRCAEAEHG